MIMTFIPIMKDDEKKYKSRCVSEYLYYIILYYRISINHLPGGGGGPGGCSGGTLIVCLGLVLSNGSGFQSAGAANDAVVGAAAAGEGVLAAVAADGVSFFSVFLASFLSGFVSLAAAAVVIGVGGNVNTGALVVAAAVAGGAHGVKVNADVGVGVCVGVGVVVVDVVTPPPPAAKGAVAGTVGLAS